jgi:lipopolysaccharide transport system ATP-binding protein
MRPIIKVEDVGKRYRIGALKSPYGTFRDRFAGWLKAPLRRLKQGERSSTEMLWALRDIDLEIYPGEVIGIIGKNGAGKSTLLKILSRITEPTIGRIELYGRVGSLLEVGTGFHPELTGRENVYLYGAILGMSRAEIKSKFDEIVAFSEIEKFIDTPVKHYSSGMYMRLAFSVPAHLEPEIMLVDEVLAVGDLSFQQKCLDRMRLLKKGGTTILLVSHNMAAIESTCENSIYLEGGTIAASGDSAEVITRYRNSLKGQSPDNSSRRHYANSDTFDTGVSLTGFEMFGEDGENRRNFQFGERVRFLLELESSRRIENPVIAIGIVRGDGVIACNYNNRYDNFKIDYLEGKCLLEGWLPPMRLIPHYYEIHVLVLPPRFTSQSQELTTLLPYAVDTFGDFSIEGVPLTEQDGVFQQPALKWAFSRGGERIEYGAADDESIFQAYGESNQFTYESV